MKIDLGIRLGMSAVALVLSAGASNADTVTYDASLASPGVYFGTGNINSGFTVDQSNNIELGLEAIQRYIGPVTPTGSTYDVLTGDTTVPGKSGANWGFVFSVNLQAAGGSATFPGNYTVDLTMTDVGNGTTSSPFNLLSIPDNSYYGPSGVCNGSACLSGNPYAFQNSEALSFPIIADLLNDPGYDVNANDTFNFTLSVSQQGTILASDSITVVAGTGAQPVPEPSSFPVLLAGLGLIGGAFYFGRKKAKTA